MSIDILLALATFLSREYLTHIHRAHSSPIVFLWIILVTLLQYDSFVN